MKNKINQLKKQLKNERGLTLVELLAVIVILAIISIIAFVFIGGIIENSKKDAHIANAQQIISAAKLHEATSSDFTEITAEELQEGNYLDQILDPWEKKQYENLKEVVVKKDKADEGSNHEYEYKITFKVADKCEIDGKTEAQLANEDRNKICGTD